MNPLVRILTASQRRKVRKLFSIAPLINALEPEMQALDDVALGAKTAEFKQRLENGETLDDIMVEAYAVVREASVRTTGMRHFDAQMIGGIVLHQGAIAEMKTGEGKTLVATLPVYLNALTGQGVHVVTVNDYLARRDSEWMGQIYRLLNVSVGALQTNMRPSDRRPIYQGDIIYGQNNEFGFDYLRDNIFDHKDLMAQRGHNFAIIDEVDSILIDEARTPMIISGAGSESAKTYQQFASIARRLVAERDYEVDEGKRNASITEEGVRRVEEMLGVENLYDALNEQYIHYLTASIKAKEIYKRDREYVVKDGEIIIVDEFTGRLQPGRRWSDGIHQSVESKEGVKIREEHRTQATVTVQNYFRMYEKLSGMTGTAMTEATEFDNIYKLEVFEIPTHRTNIRKDDNDQIFKTEEAKWRAVVEDIKLRNSIGQPVLVGTVSVEKNEKLSRMLERQGVPHELLNAKNHEREGTIIAQAGRIGGVTVATNMAGRGVDIILGGSTELEAKDAAVEAGITPETPEFEAFVKKFQADKHDEWVGEHQKVVDLGGLYVLGTERHESRRIDNQLRGRAARQGDPGASRFYLSLRDDLMQRFAADKVESIMDRLKLEEDTPIEAKLVSKSILRAQRQIESMNFEIRKNVLKYDDVLNTQREVIYTERKKILDGDDLSEQTRGFVENVVVSIVDTYCPQGSYEEEWDMDGLLVSLREILPNPTPPDNLKELDYEGVLAWAIAEGNQAYEAKEQELGSENMRRGEQVVLLHVLDQAWRDHLDEMDHLQEGISLRAMAQRDPLVEYQREGYDLFQGMMSRIQTDFAKYILHIHSTPEPESNGEVAQRAATRLQYVAPAKTSEAREAQQKAYATSSSGGAVPQARQETIRHEEPKVGRNDPCPCGSGRKYKKCHGLNV